MNRIRISDEAGEIILSIYQKIYAFNIELAPNTDVAKLKIFQQEAVISIVRGRGYLEEPELHCRLNR